MSPLREFLRGAVLGGDYIGREQEELKRQKIIADLEEFRKQNSDLAPLYSQSRQSIPGLEPLVPPTVEPNISGQSQIDPSGVDRQIAQAQEMRRALDERQAADSQIQQRGTFEQRLNASPLRSVYNQEFSNEDPAVSPLDLKGELSLMKQAEQDTVAPAREGIGQFADLYRDQVPARADLTNLLANTGRIDKAFEQASTLSGEIPTEMDLAKEERLKNKDALEREKEDRLSDRALLAERMFQYTQRKDYSKAASQTGISVTALQSVDNALSELGVVGGIYGKPTEDLSAFVGVGTKFWRDWLNGDRFGDLRIATRQLVTGQLKDVSGAAVTDQEAERFMRSMGLNARSSASEFLTALQMLAKQKETILGNALAPAEAGVKDGIRQPGSGFIDPEPFAPKPSAEDEYEWDPVTRKLVRVK